MGYLQRTLEKVWRADSTHLKWPCDIHMEILGRLLDKVNIKIRRESEMEMQM